MLIRILALFLLLSSPALARSSGEIMRILEEAHGEKPYKLFGQICLPKARISGSNILNSDKDKCWKKKQWNAWMDPIFAAAEKEPAEENAEKEARAKAEEEEILEKHARFKFLYPYRTSPYEDENVVKEARAKAEEEEKTKTEQREKRLIQNRKNPKKAFKAYVVYKDAHWHELLNKMIDPSLDITPSNESAQQQVGTQVKLDFTCTDDFGDRLFSNSDVRGRFTDNGEAIFVKPSAAGNQWALTIPEGTYRNCSVSNARYVFN